MTGCAAGALAMALGTADSSRCVGTSFFTSAPNSVMLMILFLLLVLEFLLAASGTFTKFRDASCVSPSDDPVRFTA